jgi:subtilisin family serine protease
MTRALTALFAIAALVAPAVAQAAGDPRRAEQWALDIVEADKAWPVSTGDGAVVAVVDSGVQADHPDLAGRLLPGRDFVQNDAVPQDGDGHGTHVTGTIVATAGNGIGIAGVAPGAMVLPVRVLGDDGSGTTADVAKGIDWARTQAVDVINLSLGSDVPLIGAIGGDDLDAAIRRALAAGIVVVAAAGNNSMPVCEQPAVDAGLLCVGAIDKRRLRSFYSSFGRGLSLVAPGGSGAPVTGEDVLSTMPPSTYEELAGTSQAAPHVSGVAALLAARGVRGKAAAARILATATDLGPPGADPLFGAGVVNARAAVAGLGTAATTAPAATPAETPPAPAAPAAPTRRGAFRAPKRMRIATALRYGIPVAAQPSVDGRVTVSGRRLSRIARKARGGTTRIIRVKLSRKGEKVARRGRPFTVELRATLPGETQARRARVRLTR